ncbi:4Fe-4S binding protein [Saccharicrinis sp. FJH54]|uniref:4Fe-4S binding protein n=1 Tax=Saccharicrinis sp. FJH54 TaxID=3344665 RepID=UPI0035D4ED71
MKNSYLPQFLIVIFLLFFISEISYASEKISTPTQVESSEDSACAGCPNAALCESENESLPLKSLIWPVPLILIAGGLWFFKKIRTWSFLLFAGVIAGIFTVQLIYADNGFANGNHGSHGSHSSKSGEKPPSEEFAPFDEAGSEEFAPFEEAEVSSSNADESAPFETQTNGQDNDEFKSFSDGDNEFAAFEGNTAAVNAEHKEEEHKGKGDGTGRGKGGHGKGLGRGEGGHGESLEHGNSTAGTDVAVSQKEQDARASKIRYVAIILLITLLAGILSLFKRTRQLRPLFLLGGLIYMGFYNGGCPCMISSFQEFVMWLFGAPIFWGLMLWFVGLLVITYFFGRVWCGWFCHLGALQEFLYKAAIVKPLRSVKAQKVLKIMRNVTIVVLVVQIAVTHTNVFIHYDPFKVAFNLFSAHLSGYILLFILLVSSLMINRPFCRGFCPVGLVMGWVSRLPGASILKPSDDCIGCRVCNNACEVGAITREDKVSTIDNAECIRCGNCQDNCTKSAINQKFGNSKIVFDCVKPL